VPLYCSFHDTSSLRCVSMLYHETRFSIHGNTTMVSHLFITAGVSWIFIFTRHVQNSFLCQNCCYVYLVIELFYHSIRVSRLYTHHYVVSACFIMIPDFQSMVPHLFITAGVWIFIFTRHVQNSSLCQNCYYVYLVIDLFYYSIPHPDSHMPYFVSLPFYCHISLSIA